MVWTALSASAQTTAEDIMALLPKMPTEAEMIKYHREYNAPATENITLAQPQLYTDFLEALKEAKDKADEMAGEVGESSKAKLMKGKVAGSDYTVEDFDNMSEAEQEKAAMAIAQKRLAKMGLSLSDLPKEGEELSETQKQAIASKVTAKAKSGQLPKTNANQAELMMKLQELGTEESRLVMTIDDPLKAAAEEGRKLYERDYKAKIDNMIAQQRALKYVFMEKYTEEDRPKVEAETKKYNELAVKIWQTENEFYAKYIPMWRKALLASMDFCKKTLIPIEQQRREVTEQLYEMTQDANYTMGDTYPLVGAAAYLDQSGKIDEYDNYLKPEAEE